MKTDSEPNLWTHPNCGLAKLDLSGLVSLQNVKTFTNNTWVNSSFAHRDVSFTGFSD